MRNFNFLLLILTSLSISSCSQNELPNPNMAEAPVVSLKQQAIKRYIDQRHPVKSRSNTQLIPILQHGDTVAFLANYTEGWELFSNNTSLPMVLMKSEKYNFYPNVGALSDESDSSFLDFYNGLINGLSSYPEDEDPNPTWVLYSEDRDPGVDPVPSFVGIAATVEKQTYTPKGGRLKTQWNQRGYYNLYTPFYKDSTKIHSPLGCSAVAVGQMAYHSNKYFGVPTHTSSKAGYNKDSNTYYFYESSTSAWGLIDSGENESFCKNPIKMETTAAFLGNIAVQIRTKFGTKYSVKELKGSGANIYYTIHIYLNYWMLLFME